MSLRSLATVLCLLFLSSLPGTSSQIWTDEPTPSNFDLEAVTAASLRQMDQSTRSSFFIAGQNGIWRGDEPLQAKWDLVLDEVGKHYRAIVQVADSSFGNLVAAVGDDGDVASSRDGVDWETDNVASASNFTGLAVGERQGNLLLVAVDDGGRIFSGGSVSGLAVVHTEAGVVWHDVAFGNGTWIAVGSDGNYALSTDALSWQVNPGDIMDGRAAVDLHGIAFGPPTHNGGLFVAVGADDTISKSSSGLSWECDQSPGSTRLWRAVSFVPRHAAWVIFGDGGLARISHDGADSWGFLSDIDLPAAGMNGAAFGLGYTVAVGDGGRVFSSITRLRPSQRRLTFEPAGGSEEITINNSATNAEWDVTVLDGSDFISVVPSFGEGNVPNSFTITVDPFGTFDTRTGLVVLNDLPITIAQTGEGDPLPVGFLEAFTETDQVIRLEWTPAFGATDYEVQRRRLDDPVDAFEPVAVVEGSENASRIVHLDRNGLTGNTTYCYQVVALNGVNRTGTFYYPSGASITFLTEVEFGRSDPSDEACALTQAAGAGGFVAEVIGELEGIQLNWTPAPDAEGYQLRRREGAGDFFLLANLPPGASDYFDAAFGAGLGYLQAIAYELTPVTTNPEGAIPVEVSVNTGPSPIFDASVVAEDIDPDGPGPLEGTFLLGFSRESINSFEVQSRTEPGGPWQPISPIGPSPTANLSQVSETTDLGVTTTVWRFFQPEATRSFRMRTRNGPLLSRWTELGPVSTPPPANPTGFVLTERTANSGTFSWDDVSGETSYELMVRPSSAIDDSQDVIVSLAPDSTSGSVSGLFPGTSYDAFLVAIGDEGDGASSRSTQGAASATLTFSTLPSAPFPVTATVLGPTGISITWGEVVDAIDYEVWRSDFFAGGFQPYQLVTVASAPVPPTSDFSVSGGRSYRYQVRARVGDDFTSFRESNIVGTPADRPTVTSTTPLSGSEIEVDWSDPNPFDPISYRVEYSTR